MGQIVDWIGLRAVRHSRVSPPETDDAGSPIVADGRVCIAGSAVYAFGLPSERSHGR